MGEHLHSTKNEYIIMLQEIASSMRDVSVSMSLWTDDEGTRPFAEIGERLETQAFHLATLIGDIRMIK